jgi:hypothetical protein
VQRELLDERLEILGARHEVGLAVHLHEHADLAAHVDVAADDAVARGAAGALRGRRESLLAEVLDRLLLVAAGLLQGGLALHHPRARLVAQGLHHACRDFHDCESSS